MVAKVLKGESLSLQEYLERAGVQVDEIEYASIMNAKYNKENTPEVFSQVMTYSFMYAEKRQKAKKEYEELVKTGWIVQKQQFNMLLQIAKYGDPNEQITKAARRVCQRKQLDWEIVEDESAKQKWSHFAKG